MAHISVPVAQWFPGAFASVHGGHLWWQPDDFVNFLRTRLDIAEAYKAAAHSLGVDTWLGCQLLAMIAKD